MGDFKGTIIDESLEDKAVLRGIKVTSTEVETVTERFKTPWLSRWTLYHVEIPELEAAGLAEKLSHALELKHPWYADFKNEQTHYIIFRDKIFEIDRHNAKSYEAARQYGISHGVPPHQIEFSKNIIP